MSKIEKPSNDFADANKMGDLEKAAEKYQAAAYDGLYSGHIKGYQDAFIAGAHWGAKWDRKQMRLQAEKALAKNFLTIADMVAFDKGVAEGRRLEREEMMNYVRSMLDKLKENEKL